MILRAETELNEASWRHSGTSSIGWFPPTALKSNKYPGREPFPAAEFTSPMGLVG